MHLVVLTQVLDRRDGVLGFFHAWCELFAARVARLTVLAQRVGDVALPANVEPISLGREHGSGRVRMAVRMASRLAGLTGARRPDAILAHMVPRYVLSAAPVAVPRRIPLYLWYTHKGVDASLRLAAPLVRKVFTASEESFRLALPAGRRVVTGHGIDCEHFRPEGEERRTVDALSVGRLAPSKGQLELLAALLRLAPCPSCEIAGDILLDRDAGYREQVRAAAARLPPGRVRLLGEVPYTEIGAVMRRARVLVNVSSTGSVDKVVLEAMASGCIPLTCNESFAPVFGPELAGRLMFARGEPAGLAAALERELASPPVERAALAARLRGLVLEGHDVRRLVPRLVSEMER